MKILKKRNKIKGFSFFLINSITERVKTRFESECLTFIYQTNKYLRKKTSSLKSSTYHKNTTHLATLIFENSNFQNVAEWQKKEKEK